MSTVRLATACDHLSVRDLSEVAPAYEFRHQSRKPFKVNSWSPDGSSIVSSLEDSSSIVLTYVKGNVCTSVDYKNPLGNDRQVFVSLYPRTTLKLVALASQDRVALFDLARQKIRQDFKNLPGGHITCLATNHDDKYIASGTTHGSVHILNSITGRSSPNVLDGGAQQCALSAINFNNVKHSILGGCTDAGSVVFWDVNTCKKMSTFCQHRAPSTGLAFSPVNEVLVASAGLDKRCVCYDIQTKKPASTFATDQPLTSVDFAVDGTTLALGTSQGQVLLYDLRSLKDPTAILDYTKGCAVKSVLFQPTAGERLSVTSLLASVSKSSVNNSSSSSGLAASVSRKNLLKDIKENIEEPDCVSDASRKDSLGSQVFSPLRDVAGGDQQQQQQLQPLFTPPTTLRNNTSRVSNESLFSPLRENSFNMSSSNNSMMKTSLTSFDRKTPSVGTPGISPLLSSIRESVKSRQVEEEESGYHVKSRSVTEPIVEEETDGDIEIRPTSSVVSDMSEEKSSSECQMVVISTETPYVLPKGAKLSYYADEVTFEKEAEKKKPAETSVTDIKAILTAFPQVLESSVKRKVEEKVNKEHSSNSGHKVGQFQQEFVQATVQEAMDEFCSDMRKQLWHIQYDMIRSFHRQKAEMAAMMKDYAVNEELVKEVEMLREENERLKSTPFVARFADDTPHHK